ncbi:MAG: septal ring-binding cell division protein DamX [Halieaceae bacterium]
MTKTAYLSCLLCLTVSGCSYIPWFGGGNDASDKHVVGGPPKADRSTDYWCEGAGQGGWNCVEGDATSYPRRAVPSTEPLIAAEPGTASAVLVPEADVAAAYTEQPLVISDPPKAASDTSELKLFTDVPNDHYAIQLMAAEYRGQAEIYIENRELTDSEIVRVRTASGDWYVVILAYLPDLASAQLRADEYAGAHPSEKPWVRGTAELREAYRLAQPGPEAP